MKNIFNVILVLFLYLNCEAQISPGGVSGTMVWYKISQDDIQNSIFENHIIGQIDISPCSESFENKLFNYNFSLSSDNLCLEFRKHLETLTFQDFFLVGKNTTEDKNLSLLTTTFQVDNTDGHLPENYFDLNSKKVFNKNFTTEYSELNKEFLYNYQFYNVEKNKIKTRFGRNGETIYTLGKELPIDGIDYEENDAIPFAGLIPEFILFDDKLTKNQNQRVQSYLALKYGLTLQDKSSYLSSNNIEFYNAKNFKHFSKRIFGVGRDDRSGLNQLQSQSMHSEGFLSVSIDDLTENNLIKTQNSAISNRNFLVNGDNSKDATDFTVSLNNDTKRFERIWLAQFTGQNIRLNNLTYTLQLNQGQIDFFKKHPEFKIWMLIDHLASEESESDFEDPMVEYHKGVINYDDYTATFDNLNMDFEESGYDQFTFGISDKLMLTVRPIGCPGEEEDYAELDVDSCDGDMTIYIRYDVEGDTVESVIESSDNPVQFSFIRGVDYDITVVCNNGATGTTQFNFERIPIALDLGNDISLNSLNNSITLDAGINHNDQNATYRWFKDGVQLSEISSTLLATQPGIYSCELTSSDLSCVLIDEIKVVVEPFKFISDIEICQGLNTTYNVSTMDGLGPFKLRLFSPSGQTNFVFDTNLEINIFEYGDYNVEIEDHAGNVKVDQFYIEPEIEASLYTQLSQAQGESLDQINSSQGVVDLFNQSSVPLTYNNGLGEAILEFGVEGAHYGSGNFLFSWSLNGIKISTGKNLKLYLSNVHSFPDWSDPCDIEILDDAESYIVYEVENLITGCKDDYTFYFIASDTFVLLDLPCDSNQMVNSYKNNIPENSTPKTFLNSKIYPNPQTPDSRFVYELQSNDVLEGIIEIFSPSGQVIKRKSVAGKNQYRHSYKLSTSGVYLIRFTSTSGEVILDRIIIK